MQISSGHGRQRCPKWRCSDREGGATSVRGCKKATKSDTSAVSRWRMRRDAPRIARARCDAIERIAGETIRAVRAMTTAKTTDDGTYGAAGYAEGRGTTMSATSTEGLGHGGSGFSLDDVIAWGSP